MARSNWSGSFNQQTSASIEFNEAYGKNLKQHLNQHMFIASFLDLK